VARERASTGDRKGIEKQTKTWDKVIVDRSTELRSWVDVCQQTVRRGLPTYVYINNSRTRGDTLRAQAVPHVFVVKATERESGYMRPPGCFGASACSRACSARDSTTSTKW
jgi:hypothetical protein